MTDLRLSTATIALACLTAAGSAAAAETGLAQLQGAWLEQSATCEATFSKGPKGAVAFRKPVNIFAPAFIVSGNRLRTTQSSCQIKAIQPAGHRKRLILDCATSIAVSEFRALISFTEAGELRRYFNDEDKAGSLYRRCSR